MSEPDDDRKLREEGEGEAASPEASPESQSTVIAGAPASVGTASPAAEQGSAAALADEPGPDLLDEVDLRELMRQALERPPPGEPPDLLRGVQRRLRTRSRGKFYGDGWSTARTPRSTYLTTSLVMLALIAFVFLVLIPWSSGDLPVP